MIVALALLLAAPQAVPAPTPSPEAEALGRQVAESGTLASLLPVMIAKDTEELIGQHPELGEAGKAKLRAAAAETGKAGTARLMAAIGHQYALRLSVDDLKALAAFNASPVAKNWRAAEPAVIAESMKAVGEIDLKKEAWAAYCKDPAATCPVAKAAK